MRLDLVSLDFGVFADGLPFSQVKMLCERFAHRGDIGAHGQVLRAQCISGHKRERQTRAAIICDRTGRKRLAFSKQVLQYLRDKRSSLLVERSADDTGAEH
ncbi:MAG: DUF934 domain-containing protein [Gammaproteobacteria bacterium]|nr:DUF934 domain-containing protein [Gammaproteobacteria bacterium]